MTERKEDTYDQMAVAISPEHRQRVYAAAAARLQKFADVHPDVRHDVDTPEISRAIEGINEALILFIEGKCQRGQVSAAFDRYEQSLISAARINVNMTKPTN